MSYLTRFHNEFLVNTKRSELCDLYVRVPNGKISKCNWVSAAILNLCELLNGCKITLIGLMSSIVLRYKIKKKTECYPYWSDLASQKTLHFSMFLQYFRFCRHFLYMLIIGDNHITQHCSKMMVELFFAGLNMTIVS